MTEKELLYVDDTLSHTKELVEICTYLKGQLSDQTLLDLVTRILETYNRNYNCLYEKIGG